MAYWRMGWHWMSKENLLGNYEWLLCIDREHWLTQRYEVLTKLLMYRLRKTTGSNGYHVRTNDTNYFEAHANHKNADHNWRRYHVKEWWVALIPAVGANRLDLSLDSVFHILFCQTFWSQSLACQLDLCLFMQGFTVKHHNAAASSSRCSTRRTEEGANIPTKELPMSLFIYARS